MEWSNVFKKKRPNYILLTQDFSFKHTHRLEVKRYKKKCCAKGNLKERGVTNSISNKIDFKSEL